MNNYLVSREIGDSGKIMKKMSLAELRKRGLEIVDVAAAMRAPVVIQTRKHWKALL
jgi:hypothetical protein